MPTGPFRLLCAIALAVATLLPAPQARAARPMITDDARIVDPGACQLETWARAYRGGGAELWALPGCNPTGKLELTLGGTSLRPEGAPRANALQWQAKTILRKLETDSWGVGLAVGGLWIDRNEGGPRDHEPYFYVPVTASFGADRLFVHLNLGAQHSGPQTHVTRSLWGLGIEAAVTPRALLIAETFGQGGSRAQGQLGIRYWIVPNRLQIDATMGEQGGPSGLGRWFSIGLRILTPPFMP
jgi:hypothetical protein